MRRTATRAIVALVLTIGAALAAGGPAGAAVTCSNFTFQQDAQAYFNANPSSGLDRDHDGIACEDLPRRGTTIVTTATTTTAPPTTVPVTVQVTVPTTTVIAGNGGTRILTIGPAPAPAAPLVVVPATPVVAPLSLTG